MHNNKARRYLSVLLAIVFLTGLVPVMAAADNADYEYVIGLASEAQIAALDDSVEVTLSISSPKGKRYNAVQAVVAYDSVRLQYAGSDAGANTRVTTKQAGKLLVTSYDNYVPLTGGASAPVATLTFKAKATGNADISIANTGNDAPVAGKSKTTLDKGVGIDALAGIISIQVKNTLKEPLDAPVLTGAQSITDTAITLTPPAASVQDASAAIQYRSKPTNSETWGAWRSGAAFTGLAALTSYDFQARYLAASASAWSDSEPSGAVTASTLPAAVPMYDIIVGPITAYYSYELSVNGVSRSDYEIANPTYNGPVHLYGGVAKAGDEVTINVTSAPGYGIYSQSAYGIHYDNPDYNPFAMSYTYTPQMNMERIVNTDDPDYTFPHGSYTFTMYGHNTSFRIIEYVYYNIDTKTDIQNGTLTAKMTGVGNNHTVITATAVPDVGYRLRSILYSENGGGTWTECTNIVNNVGTFNIYSDAIVKAEFERLEDLTITS